jgi:FF domain
MSAWLTAAAVQKNLNAAEENFISMLEQASVRASAQWPTVAKHFANDPRFTAVPEDSRFVLFRSYIRMQQDMNALKLNDAEREYMVRGAAAACPVGIERRHTLHSAQCCGAGHPCTHCCAAPLLLTPLTALCCCSGGWRSA